jgi:glutathione-regulated potassium-efflux system ancillary protein KefG
VKKVLIVFSHSSFKESRANKAMLAKIADLDRVTIRVLEEHAPDFKFDVAKEQAVLVEHDVIVLQFPMYWYSCPALMKHWIDEVWLSGFAYGKTGKYLKDKTLVCATTAGGTAADFLPDGFYQYSVDAFFRPFEISAQFCKMNYEPPFTIYDSLELSAEELDNHAISYRDWLSQFI